MNKRKHEESRLPVPLNRVRRRFDRWPKTHQGRTRFSESLWSQAVEVARTYGHSRTAKVLGLDYYSLKKRLASSPCAKEKNSGAPAFVEFISPTLTECIIEIEDGKCGRMRISLKGGDLPDLISLNRHFWSIKT